MDEAHDIDFNLQSSQSRQLSRQDFVHLRSKLRLTKRLVPRRLSVSAFRAEPQLAPLAPRRERD